MNNTKCPIKTCLLRCIEKKLRLLDYAAPLTNLLIRFWMARIFWNSGMAKLHNWPGTLSLFATEYKVPYLSPELAACLSITVELATPVMLVLGLGTRAAAVALLVMTAVIEGTYPGYIEHAYWALLLLVLLFHGAGKISCDYFIRKKYSRAYPAVDRE